MKPRLHRHLALLAILGASCLTLATRATTITVVVPGTSDPWLAGMPDGSTASADPGGFEPADVAPDQSPVLVAGLCIDPSASITWTAAGEVGHPGDLADPDGLLIGGGGAVAPLWSHTPGAENGISDIYVPIDALLGVFLSDAQPDLLPAPGGLDFSTALSRDYVSLTPDLQQVFFMGDGLTSGGVVQTLIPPAGATRLYLGTMDGYSWNNNIGQFEVTLTSHCVPDSCEFGWLAWLGVLWVARRYRG